MIDKNREALKQQPIFKEEKIEEQQRQSYNPVFQNPLNAMQEAGGADDEDDEEALLEEIRDEVGEVVEKEAKPFKQEMKKNEASKQGVFNSFKARRKEMDEEQKQKKEASKAKNRSLSDSTYSSLLASMKASAEMEKDELKSFVKNPDVQQLKSEHKIKTRTRVIKHTLKQDEVIVERIVENKKEKVKTKKENASLLADNETMVKDSMINLRKSVDINDKKGMTYTDFEELSVFGLKMKDGALSTLASLYGEGERIKKGNSDDDPKTTTYAALNMMTAEIMKLDESAYDVHTDEALVKQSGELSIMSRMVKSYQGFLSKNPDYIDYLSKQKDENGTMAEQMYTKLNRLSAIGQYYRLRKLVLEDPYYIEHANEEIPLTAEEGDSSQVQRLKKMMLASAQCASNLQNIFGAAKVPNIRLTTGRHADMLGALTMKTIDDLSKMNEDEKLRNIKLSINSLGSSNMMINQLESESFFQAPMWVQNALTLNPEEIKKKMPDRNFGLATVLSAEVELNLVNLMKASGCEADKVRDEDLYKGVLEQRKKYGKLKNTYDKKWKEANGPVRPELDDYAWADPNPKFKNAEDIIFAKKLDISDNWNRLENSIAGSFSYKRTNAETLEMIEHLRIQENKEEWDKVKNDREAKAFYESSFKEAARKLLFAQYACARRLNETVCIKMLAMHPTDLLYQATPELHALLLQASTATNPFIDSQKEQIRNLFAQDNEGNYAFDIDDVYTHTNMSGAQNMKFTQFMSEFCHIRTCDSRGYRDICRKLYGNGNLFASTIAPAFLEAKAANDPVALTVSENKHADIAWWYLSKHPEMLDKKILHKKSGGEFILQHIYNDSATSMIQGGEKSFREGFKKKIVDIPSNKELDAYQEYLKKEGYPKIRTESTTKYDDEDGFYEEEIEPEKVIPLPGCAEKVLTGAEIIKNRKEDPYALNVVRNGFSEFAYIDDNGKERVREPLSGY
ncbi:MAG: hypothetical protein K6C41_00440 [Lachnospiraceae bacterium]|nr:hypothetical protein [Lachnospiraceae bacterium]